MVSRLVILPLFPYPTLFRSRPDARDGKERAEERTVPAYLGRIADVSGVKLAALVEIANESPYERRGGYADDIERRDTPHRREHGSGIGRCDVHDGHDR